MLTNRHIEATSGTAGKSVTMDLAISSLDPEVEDYGSNATYLTSLC